MFLEGPPAWRITTTIFRCTIGKAAVGNARLTHTHNHYTIYWSKGLCKVKPQTKTSLIDILPKSLTWKSNEKPIAMMPWSSSVGIARDCIFNLEGCNLRSIPPNQPGGSGGTQQSAEEIAAPWHLQHTWHHKRGLKNAPSLSCGLHWSGVWPYIKW